MNEATHHPLSPGVIEPQAVYTKEEFLLRTGLRPAAYREARRMGLPVRYKHKRAFILGSDWIDYVTREDENADGRR